MIFDFISQDDDIVPAGKADDAVGRYGRVPWRVLWRYFLAVWCLAGMLCGLKAVAIGVFLIWLGYPVLMSMKLTDLARQKRVVSDGGTHRWFVSIGGVRQQENIVSLKNVFFHSQEDMRRVLLGFCRGRLLLYAAALLVALHDCQSVLQRLQPGDWQSQGILLMALASAMFFLRRSLVYFRLLMLGQRQQWQVGTATIDDRTLFAAYKPCPGNGGETLYVPYLLAIVTPRAA